MTRPLSEKQVYLNLDDQTHAKLKADARMVGRPMSVRGGEIIAAYYQHRLEIGDYQPQTGEKKAHMPLLQDIVDAAEGRLVATISRQTEYQIGIRADLDEMKRLIRMGILAYLQNTPEISPEWKASHRKSGLARYEKVLLAVQEKKEVLE